MANQQLPFSIAVDDAFDRKLTKSPKDSFLTQLEKFPSVIAKWESIVHALEPFTVEPGLDPNTAYMVPRPETQELDSAISLMESQIQDLNVRNSSF